ncbi:ATP-binding cassette domain-containing protein [Spirochaeta africana]|uniref:ABC-type multidrug transport system, ATPase component n=1 Tax=Spirochaeta africana (strain ATCC 700263 / DSM 8902 / Z-7692) TaxID=889378 RepID=H9UHT2_SPIAZ|nr:ABC transporter ATP-binding protein [Spirochaeta africana]AFG37075.1 ABC-type multidrug transport system, ATPase component [Spirochaeta africana DSM 8902]
MRCEAEFLDVTLRYGKTTALDAVSCCLQPGTTYGLIGRNGAGKTSMLSLLASCRRPSSGTVRIGGEEPFENANRMGEVHLVYSRDMSEEDDSIRVTLEHAARYRPGFDMAYARDLLSRFRLDPAKPLNKLSVGMQAAVNVVEGLASGAAITLFDEVHHGMDAPSRQLFYEALIEARQDSDRIIVLSTHLVSEMAYLFDQVMVLDRGRMVIDEPYDTVVDRGVTVTGPAAEVDSFSGSYTVIDRKTLGGTAAVMLYGSLSARERAEASARGLELSPVSLQELFIHLTKEENAYAINQS